jgi:hypothetical protein
LLSIKERRNCMMKQVKLNFAKYKHTSPSKYGVQFLLTTMMLRSMTMKMETPYGWMLLALRWLNLIK